jgi:hypothetical protein
MNITTPDQAETRGAHADGEIERGYRLAGVGREVAED